MLLELHYFGIDFIECEITAAKEKFKKNNLNGQVKCLSLLDLNHTTTPVPNNMKTICFLPFNVFGNIFDPQHILQLISSLKYAMLISTYRNDRPKHSLLQYYKACGLSNIELSTLEHGSMFHSKEGFKSIIYNSDYIYHIASQLKLTINNVQFGKLGNMYYIRPINFN